LQANTRIVVEET